MKVELIPVIEITNYDYGKTPDNGPYWEYPEDWDNYHRKSNIEAGFSENLKPNHKGSSLYNISELSDHDLLKAIQKEIIIQQMDEEQGVDDVNCAFYGGYVLRIDGVDIYYPQCCGDLAGIKEWAGLLEDTQFFYPGHPFPKVSAADGNLIFDFVNIEIQENFAPPVPVECLVISKEDLRVALKRAKEELDTFASRLIKINNSENIGIAEIDKKLIYGNVEFLP